MFSNVYSNKLSLFCPRQSSQIELTSDPALLCRNFGLWVRDAALPDLLSAPSGPGADYDGVLRGRELLTRISGRRRATRTRYEMTLDY